MLTIQSSEMSPTRTFVSPTRVVWTSGDSGKSAVTAPEMLLAKRYGQVPEGKFLDGSGCRLENKGEPASVLVDFGCELHGGLQLVCGGPTTKGTQVRVRFGESVAEAMAELGDRGACNDHAIRDSVIDLPWAGSREIGNTGFRFVRVDLVSKGVLSLESLRAISVMRPAHEMHDTVLGVNGVQGVSTFYGYYMLEAMAKTGELQHGIYTVRDYWGGMLDMGATSFWEDFDLDWTRNAFRIDELPVPGKQDIHGDFGQFCYKGFRHSLCHGWASGPAPWLITHVLGIQIADTGCRKVRINPFLGKLAWAEGTFPTPKGVIKVRHERTQDGTIKSDISLPKGCRRLTGNRRRNA